MFIHHSTLTRLNSVGLSLENKGVGDFCGGSSVVFGEWSEDVDLLAGGFGDPIFGNLLFALMGALQKWQ